MLNKKPLPSDPHGRLNMDVELTVGFLSFKERYVSKVVLKPYESVEVSVYTVTAPMTSGLLSVPQAVAASSTPLFKTLDTVWRFQPASAQSPHPAAGTLPGPGAQTASPSAPFGAAASPTLVTLDLSFAFANPVHAAVSASVFGQVSKMMVKAFEERCLEIYGPGDA